MAANATIFPNNHDFDDFYQRIYVAEEQGPEGNPGVYASNPDGTPFEQVGTNRFGNDGEFAAIDNDTSTALVGCVQLPQLSTHRYLDEVRSVLGHADRLRCERGCQFEERRSRF
ncbi:MAG: hypothetical protein ACI9UA_006211 [Pseudoalteromonas tetraodonis]|jgi:hypothetical protein